MRLKHWFYRKTRLPLFAIAAIVIALASVQLFRLRQEAGEYRAKALRHMTEVAGIALKQNNRTLIESTLNASEWQIGSSCAALCFKKRITVSSRLSNMECPSASPRKGLIFSDEIIRAPISGFADYEMRLGVPWFHGKGSLLGLILFSAAPITGLFVLIRRIEGSLRNEILQPLTEGMLSNSPLHIQEFEEHRQAFAEAQRTKTSEAISQAVIHRGQQVAHDIRSPITAIDMILNTVPEIAEEKRLSLRRAVTRIRDIAHDLKRPVALRTIQMVEIEGESKSVQLLSTLVDELVAEKRNQYRPRLNVEIDSQSSFCSGSYGAFADIQPTEFRRVLSNLINNSVESIIDAGKVEIFLTASSSQVMIEVRDNGKGIPPQVLARLGQRGETYDKEGGSGLGLYHAQRTIESWGGSLEIISQVSDSGKEGHGTSITLRIPRASAPAWFVPKIELKPNQCIVILDDDLSIHHVWNGRFKVPELETTGINLLHYSSPQEVTDSIDGALYLVDYEFLGHDENGLDCIKRLGIADSAILVTSRFDEPSILARAQELGVRMIPKGLSGVVPVISEAPARDVALGGYFDAILIDDDEVIRDAWRFSAVTNKKEFRSFDSLEQFESIAAVLDRSTPVFVDLWLADGASGLTVSKILHDRGFTELHICTGTDAESLGEVPWVKGIRDKVAPWC
ncbi:HAMP domain-containing sensor histidine kinase [Bdellovibrionota bacterium FG-2]